MAKVKRDDATCTATAGAHDWVSESVPSDEPRERRRCRRCQQVQERRLNFYAIPAGEWTVISRRDR
jgi:hypothetical protein